MMRGDLSVSTARAVVAALVLLVGCVKGASGGFEPVDGDSAAPATEASAPDAARIEAGGGAPDPGGSDYPDGGCNPFNCRSGCCANDACLAGTAPAQCGKGGLVCVDCTAVGQGCVDQGCGVATCTACDGCCQAGSCNGNGKTQDNACGSQGGVCTDCTSSGQTCDGNGHCH